MIPSYQIYVNFNRKYIISRKERIIIKIHHTRFNASMSLNGVS